MYTKRFWLFGYSDMPIGGLNDYITESDNLTQCIHHIPFWANRWHVWDNIEKKICLKYQNESENKIDIL